MKILYCDECRESKTYAYLNVTIAATLSHTYRGTALHYGAHGVEVQDLDNLENLRCNDCDGNLRVIKVKKCSHSWRVNLSNAAKRQCEICGVEEIGSVIWP